MRQDWHRIDLYAVLGVAPDASQDDIAHAFHRRARETHPDTNPGDPDAEERFKRVAAAHQVLGDPTTRAEYDRVRGIAAPTASDPDRPHSARRWAGPPGYDPDDDALWDTWPPPEEPGRPPTVRRGGRRVWLRPPWFPDPWMVAVVGALLVATALVVDWQDSRVPDGWIVTTAVTTDEIPPPDGCIRNCDMDYWIEATLRGGGTDRHLYDGPTEVGERLPFAYDPDGHRWKVLNQGRYVPWTMGLPGVVLLLASGVLALVSVRPRRYPLRPA